MTDIILNPLWLDDDDDDSKHLPLTCVKEVHIYNVTIFLSIKLTAIC